MFANCPVNWMIVSQLMSGPPHLTINSFIEYSGLTDKEKQRRRLCWRGYTQRSVTMATPSFLITC